MTPTTLHPSDFAELVDLHGSPVVRRGHWLHTVAAGVTYRAKAVRR